MVVGWKLTAKMYLHRIHSILCCMRDAIPTVLPRNRNAVDKYFTVWWWLTLLIDAMDAGIQEREEVALRSRFQEYIDLEEERIHQNLKKVSYHIDASDTLSLILGPGRLEKVRVYFYFFLKLSC